MSIGDASDSQVSVLHRISNIVSSDLSLDEMLGEVVGLTVQATACDACLVYLIDPDTHDIVLKASQVPHAAALDNLRMKPGEGITGWVAEHKSVVALSSNAQSDTRFKRLQALVEDTYEAFLSVPLVSGGEVIGVINVHHRQPHEHSREEIGIVVFIGEQLGVTISRSMLQAENARLLEEERAKHLMDEELRVARTIQQSLLPAHLPTEGWLRAAASSMASQQVGGDYYDLVEATPDCWSAVVADVSGKGVSSALLAGVLQGALMIIGAVQGELNQGVARLNRFLLERTGGEKYATIFYCQVERGGRVRYVNAAHCPPLVLRSSGVTAVLEATGMPVGLIEGAEYEVADTRLTPGDKLLIYTDGVTEAQDAAGAFFGVKRLHALAATHGASSAETVHDAVQTAVRDFTQGAAQSDDITLLVLEYAG